MTSREKHMARSHRSYRAKHNGYESFRRMSAINGDQRIIAKANRIQARSFKDAMQNMMQNVRKGMKKIVGGNENGE